MTAPSYPSPTYVPPCTGVAPGAGLPSARTRPVRPAGRSLIPRGHR